jgi:hypothetical protein
LATVTSVQNGNWSDAATWGGVLPAAGDTINIRHIVTMDLNDSVTEFGRINIDGAAVSAAYNGQLLFKDGVQTCLVCKMWIYISGGIYRQGPGSKVLFHGTSKTGATEGQAVGIYARGSLAGTQLILEGSVPMPETSLTSAVALGDEILHVTDGSQFSAGEYIAVYYDCSNDATWGWSGIPNQSDEGFIIDHVSGNDLYITKRVAVIDTLAQASVEGASQIVVNNPKKWQPGMKVVFHNSGTRVIPDIDYDNGILYLSVALSGTFPSGTIISETGADKTHAIGDKVYKIATVLTADAAAGTNIINVANASMLEIGDRIIIEGYTRNYGKEFETTISAKTGNQLTLAGNLPYVVYKDFIITKTSRDCIVTTTDETDTNRVFVYYEYGSGINRKCVLRYADISHIGNSSNGFYYGVAIRSDFNQVSTEKEIRGCVIRNGWSLDRNGVWIYSGHYIHMRNCVVVRTYNGIGPYDSNGSSLYNNISIGNILSDYRTEHMYYYNQFQYNIGLNGTYCILGYSYYCGNYPVWHNLFKHHERGLYMSQACTGFQNGCYMKNRYVDIYYKQAYVEGVQLFAQDIEIVYSSDASFANLGSSYSNAEDKGMCDGKLIILNKDFIKDNFEVHSQGGIIYKDEVIHRGNGWSYQCKTNYSTTAGGIFISQVVWGQAGKPISISAYIRKDSAYNGNFRPKVYIKGKYNSQVEKVMDNVNDKWQKVEVTLTPNRSELLEIGVWGRGSAGTFWVDPRIIIKVDDILLRSMIYCSDLCAALVPGSSQEGISLGGVTL